jgi:hypothetical protein
MSDEDVASRREAESFERRADELVKADAREQAQEYYRQSQRILMPVNKMWSDAVEYDLRMAAFQRVQNKLWALAEGGLVRVGVPGPAPSAAERAKPPELPRPSPKFGSSAAARKFEASMVIGYEQWHDGIGYDLEALAQMTEAERQAVGKVLTARVRSREAEWRDTEALAALGGADAKAALRHTMETGDLETQLHAARELDAMGEKVEIEKIIAKVLKRGGFGQGVSMALLMVPEYDSPYMRKVLLECAQEGDRAVRVHAAAMCLYLAGLAKEPFEWAQRPFFLQFGVEDNTVRQKAYVELCRRLDAAAKSSKAKKPGNN